MSYLVDTNVISEARKPNGDANVRAWIASVRPGDLYLSVLVVGEIRRGIERLRPRDPARADLYEAWLLTLRRDYADRLIPVDAAAAETWGRLSVGNTVPTIDGLLAATALVHGLTLVTRNAVDFARTGVQLLNPFKDGTGGPISSS